VDDETTRQQKDETTKNETTRPALTKTRHGARTEHEGEMMKGLRIRRHP
jgi:hypothetical protein